MVLSALADSKLIARRSPCPSLLRITFASDDVKSNGDDVQLDGEPTAELEFIRAA
jgi:hypothetical protein